MADDEQRTEKERQRSPALEKIAILGGVVAKMKDLAAVKGVEFLVKPELTNYDHTLRLAAQAVADGIKSSYPEVWVGIDRAKEGRLSGYIVKTREDIIKGFWDPKILGDLLVQVVNSSIILSTRDTKVIEACEEVARGSQGIFSVKYSS